MTHSVQKAPFCAVKFGNSDIDPRYGKSNDKFCRGGDNISVVEMCRSIAMDGFNNMPYIALARPITFCQIRYIHIC